MKIAVVVHGRFHAFGLVRALLDQGHDVHLFTNYPARACRPWGIPAERVHSHLVHGVLQRVAGRLGLAGRLEPWLHRLFGRWASRHVGRERWDVVHTWSGVSEELLARRPRVEGVTLLMRGSTHIDEQDRLLRDEQERAGLTLDRPSSWIIGREHREYDLADRVLVLSSHSEQSFIAHGFPKERLVRVPFGVDTRRFRMSDAVITERVERLRHTTDPLRVLYVGALSYRKGLFDLERVVTRLGHRGFEFSFVGPVLPEAEAAAARMQAHARMVGKLPEHELPHEYARADIFLFPTIEDGFPIVLTQARAAALPIITTSHGAGTDIVTSVDEGWIVPIRDAAATEACLLDLGADRNRLADMTVHLHDQGPLLDWPAAARLFTDTAARVMAEEGVGR